MAYPSGDYPDQCASAALVRDDSGLGVVRQVFLSFLSSLCKNPQWKYLGHHFRLLSTVLLAFHHARCTNHWSIRSRHTHQLLGKGSNTLMSDMASTDHRKYSKIRRGEVLVQPNWLEPGLVEELLEEVRSLDHGGFFMPSGVAIAGVDGIYGKEDRRVSVLQVSRQSSNSRVRSIVESRLNALCLELREVLDRPTLRHEESYYSISLPKAKLGMHMDERHEQTKGENGWEMPTRRSISWLLYLGADDWGRMNSSGQGGELCAYSRHSNPHASCGAHDGNLQVGWLDCSSLENDTCCDEPIFLDSWVPSARFDEDGQERWHADSALYSVAADGSRKYLTHNFGPHSPGWPSEEDAEFSGSMGMVPSEFAEALRNQFPTESLQNAFSSIDSVPHARQRIIKVLPRGGTLLLFDSVALPHEVLPVLKGERIALAGWFHEDQQLFPEWYGEPVRS